MPWQAKGPYRELLDEFWSEGSLPTDMHELADIVGCSEAELTELWVHIGPCWEERDGRLYNAKMDLQRTAIDRARVAMSTGGANGGKSSNSFTRAKATEAYDKPTLEVPEGMPDIGEERRLEERKEEKTLALTSVEVRADRGKLLGTILLNRGEYEVRADDLARDGPLYPGVDVVAEYRSMKAWSIANPAKRKTAKGIARFMNQWLSKAQNEGGRNVRTQEPAINRPSPAQQRRESSNAGIDAAFAGLRAAQPARDDATGACAESQPGHPRGHGGDVRTGVGGVGADVRSGDIPGRVIEGIA